MNHLRSVVIVVVLASAVVAQRGPRTVTEFYLALPGSVNGIDGTSDSSLRGFEDDFLFYSNERNESKAAIAKYRRSLIKVEDIRNGYLRLEGRGWEGWVEIALFKETDNSYIVAISQVGCGPGCSGGLLLLGYRNAKWINLTRQIFPASSFSEKGYFKLPRHGTTIQLICSDENLNNCKDGKILSEFHWNRTKFIQ